MSFSKSFVRTGKTEIGLELDRSLSSPSLEIGATVTGLYDSGNILLLAKIFRSCAMDLDI